MKSSNTLIAFISALSLHLIVGGVLLMGVDFSFPKEKPKNSQAIIKASVVSQQLFEDLALRKAAAITQEKKRVHQEKQRIKREIEKIEARNKKQIAEKQAAEKRQAEKIQKEKKRLEVEKVAKENALKEAKRVAEVKKNKQLAAIKEAKRLAVVKETKRLVAVKEAKRVAAVKETKRLAAIKEKKRIAAVKKAQRLAAAKEKKRLAAVKEAQRVADIKTAKRKAAQKKERLRQAELDKQMEAEFADAFSSAQSDKQLSEIAKYKSLIQDKISRIWIIEPSMKGKRCTLAIRLAPDGLVLSVKASSGDHKLCDSAKRATFKARTLPIPKDPEISAQFRDFDITLEPDL